MVDTTYKKTIETTEQKLTNRLKPMTIIKKTVAPTEKHYENYLRLSIPPTKIKKTHETCDKSQEIG